MLTRDGRGGGGATRKFMTSILGTHVLTHESCATVNADLATVGS